MSDDFLSDVSAAVDSGGKTPEAEIQTPANIGTDTKTQQTPKEVRPDLREHKSVADELSTMFENNDPRAKKETKPEDKKEVKQDETKNLEEKNKDDELKKKQEQELNQKPRSQRKGQERLLDTFLQEDEKGNLVNDAGEIIALAGKSRTYYEGLKNEARKQRKAASDLAVSHMQLAQQFKELYNEYKTTAENGVSPIQSIVKETGFSENEAKEAVNLLRQYKKDPINAIKNMLTQAKMSGIDVSKIGANISVDPASIRSSIEALLDERLKPLSDKASQDTDRDEAIREATEFFKTYPEARNFVGAIEQAKMQFPQMPLPEIWLRLRRELENRSSQQQQRSSTKHRRETRKTREAPKNVQAPVRDYSTMSFEEIANSIVKDNS